MLKDLKKIYKLIQVLSSDKNRGNVITYRDFWYKFNIKHIKDNPNNFKCVKINKNKIINTAINDIKFIIIKNKNYFNDYGKIIKYILSNKYNKIGRWSSMPKVHKKDQNGLPIKKLRPIINVKNTITTLSSTIIKEITRKIIYALKSMYQSNYDCDDIRDIIVNINEYNNKHKTEYGDQLITCDINSMYDNISYNDVVNAFNVSINELLPFNYISPEFINLWHKAMKHLFKYCFFECQNNYYLQTNSQIQGSVSGGDTCSLVLVIKEIKNNFWFNKLTKFIVRYKDDILFIPKIKVKNQNQCKNQIIDKLYPGFEFEYELNGKIANICDITVEIKNNILSTTTIKTDKVISYINKSSNIKQNLNGIFKTLQQRYIIIEDNINKYKLTKTRIINILINNNEWTSYDIRKCVHLKYRDRFKFIDNYINNKQNKYNKYTDLKKITLLNKEWYKIIDNKQIINNYITYQKTMINDKMLKIEINDAVEELPDDIKDEIKVNIFYKYQPSLKEYI